MPATTTTIDLSRVRQVVSLLPAGPFTVGGFLGLAVGINAIDNSNDVMPMLAALSDAGDIMKIHRDVPMWVRLRTA